MEQSTSPSEGPVRRRTSEERQEWLARYRQSGLSQREFCERHPLPLSTLTYWLRRERRQPQESPLEAPALQELSLPALLGASPASAWVAELSVPGGRILRLAAGVPPGLVPQLLSALGC
jgi:transposase-like protein